MKEIATQQGFQTTALLSSEALKERVVKEISDAAGKLESGDIMWVSFAGHGIRVFRWVRR